MKSKKKFTKLSPQQWALYGFLKRLVETENNRTTTIQEIVDMFPTEYELKAREGNKSNCPKVYEDLKAITMTDEVDMIVTTKRNHIRLGTELDVLKRLLSLIERTRWEEQEIRSIKQKIKQNRQFKLLSNADVPICESSPNTKLWHVAFSNENIALTVKQLEEDEKARKKLEKND